MKKIIIILVLFMAVFSFTGCKTTDAKKFKKEYESLNGQKTETGKVYRKVKLSNKNPFIYKDAQEIVDMIDNEESFVVYFGFSKCPWCRSIIEQLEKVAKDNNYEKIYYVDVLDIRDVYELDKNNKAKETKKGSNAYYELLKRLDSVLDDYILTDSKNKTVKVGEKRIYAPNVVAIVNGKAKQLETGISKKQTDPYMKLTDKMKKETYNKFKCLIKCIIKESNICESKTSC